MQEKNIIHLMVGPIATNCWICPIPESKDDGHTACAIIDPGADPDKIISVLNQLKYIPRYILLTHGHFDHIGALPFLYSEYRKESNGKAWPQIAIHGLDSQYLGSASYKEHRISFEFAAGSADVIDEYWNDMPAHDFLLEEGGTVGQFTVLHLPGHTKGSIALWDKEGKNLFSGDTLFKSGRGRTDLPGGDEDEIFDSLNRLFQMDGDIRVFPGHGPSTTIGAEARRGIF
ncbi:MAG: MBL fold metallo-hydrolase [Treponema sp.]|nr:MBL fold metallo-hydrolase [Treponema sp.]